MSPCLLAKHDTDLCFSFACIKLIRKREAAFKLYRPVICSMSSSNLSLTMYATDRFGLEPMPAFINILIKKLFTQNRPDSIKLL